MAVISSATVKYFSPVQDAAKRPHVGTQSVGSLVLLHPVLENLRRDVVGGADERGQAGPEPDGLAQPEVRDLE